MMDNNKTTRPLVSISCITFNHAPYIRECLDGFIKQQTVFPFEVLIHDDCSTDGTTEIIREYEKKYPGIIKPMYERENQYSQGKPSGSYVWNFPRAEGKYIAMCEGDDYWTDPLKLQKQVDFLESNPMYGLVYGKVNEFCQDSHRFKGRSGGPCEKFEELIINNTIPTPTVLIRKKLIDSYLKERDKDSNYLMDDYPMWLYISWNSKVKFHNNIYAVYRILNGSASHPLCISKWLRFQESYRDIKMDFIRKFLPDDRTLISAVKLNHMKNILRQRTLYNPELKAETDKSITLLDCGSLKKSLYRLMNHSIIVNLLLKLHLLCNNHRNHRK